MTQETLQGSARRRENLRKVKEALGRIELAEKKLAHLEATFPAARRELESARVTIEGVLAGATEGDGDGDEK